MEQNCDISAEKNCRCIPLESIGPQNAIIAVATPAEARPARAQRSSQHGAAGNGALRRFRCVTAVTAPPHSAAATSLKHLSMRSSGRVATQRAATALGGTFGSQHGVAGVSASWSLRCVFANLKRARRSNLNGGLGKLFGFTAVARAALRAYPEFRA